MNEMRCCGHFAPREKLEGFTCLKGKATFSATRAGVSLICFQEVGRVRNDRNVRNHSFDSFSTSRLDVKSSFAIGAWYHYRFEMFEGISIFCRRVEEILGSEKR